MTPDEQSLRNLVQQLQDAWNAADSNAFAAPFAENCAFIHIYGGQLDSRAAVEEAHRVIWNGIYKGSRNRYTVQSIRFLGSDAAIVLLEAGLQFQEQGQASEINARPTLVAAKE